ncbi:MAG: transglutaminase-like domain-containing protein [Paludibacter sp.]|jgi:hypothetical protein|nr:transglutaminase-like domain-containing protein [Paludibacter sp.]
MNKLLKIVIPVGVVAAVGVWALSKVKSLQSFYNLLSITPKLDGGLSKIKIDLLSGITIPIAVDFANRTAEQVTVGIQAIDIAYKNKIVAQSLPTSSEITVKGNSISTLKGLSITISIFNLVSVGGSIVNTILASGINAAAFQQLIADFEMRATCIFNRAIIFSFASKFGDTVEVKQETQKAVSGLGLVANTARRIRPFAEYEMYIPPKTLLGHDDLIVNADGDVEDTVQLMHEAARKYKSDTTTLAAHLEGKTVPETLQNIFDFVYNYIKYEEDSRTIEQVRRPLRTLWDRRGDCDCYSVLIGSILENLGIAYKFRIAAYNGRDNYQHVYVIVPTDNGANYYVCDPVVDRCFYEKPTSKHKDF